MTDAERSSKTRSQWGIPDLQNKHTYKSILYLLYFYQVLVEGNKNNCWLEAKAVITRMENYFLHL